MSYDIEYQQYQQPQQPQQYQQPQQPQQYQLQQPQQYQLQQLQQLQQPQQYQPQYQQPQQYIDPEIVSDADLEYANLLQQPQFTTVPDLEHFQPRQPRQPQQRQQRQQRQQYQQQPQKQDISSQLLNMNELPLGQKVEGYTLGEYIGGKKLYRKLKTFKR